jgi:hypothetical protein
MNAHAKIEAAVPAPKVNRHQEWLTERDRQLTIANRTAGLSDEEAQPFIDAADALEERIISTPAIDRDGLMVKALLAASLASIERTISLRACQIVFDEAKALGLIEFAS